MQGLHSKVAFGALSMLVSLMPTLPRLSLFFCVAVFSYLETLCRIVTFLIIVETSDMIQVLASRTANVGGMDTGVWDEVFPGLLAI